MAIFCLNLLQKKKKEERNKKKQYKLESTEIFAVYESDVCTWWYINKFLASYKRTRTARWYIFLESKLRWIFFFDHSMEMVKFLQFFFCTLFQSSRYLLSAFFRFISEAVDDPSTHPMVRPTFMERSRSEMKCLFTLYEHFTSFIYKILLFLRLSFDGIE